MIDPFCDSLLKFGNVVEDTSAYLLASDFGEEALNQIEPGRRCRDEVQLETRMALEPTLYGWRLVRGVVVDNQMEIEIREGFLVDLLQKLEEFPGTMAWQVSAMMSSIESRDRAVGRSTVPTL